MMTHLYLFTIPVLVSPIVALLDYYLLRNHVVMINGDPPPKLYWLIPCVLELGLFTLGLYVGYGICEVTV